MRSSVEPGHDGELLVAHATGNERSANKQPGVGGQFALLGLANPQMQRAWCAAAREHRLRGYGLGEAGEANGTLRDRASNRPANPPRLTMVIGPLSS